MAQVLFMTVAAMKCLKADCDCDGNELDALGVCGGSCSADVGCDGICDDVDECVGLWMLAAFATVQVRFMSAVALTLLKVIAIAMAMC